WICSPWGIFWGSNHSQGNRATAASAGVSKGPRSMRHGLSHSVTSNAMNASVASIRISMLPEQGWARSGPDRLRSTHAGQLGHAFHTPHLLHHFHHAATLHFFHHALHLLKLLEQTVDFLHMDPRSIGDAALARGLQN